MSNLRGYQEELVSLGKRDDYIFVLPTGAGKTLIGVSLILHGLKTYPRRSCLFIAPTVALCRQQASVIEEELAKFKELPDHKVVEVSGTKSFDSYASIFGKNDNSPKNSMTLYNFQQEIKGSVVVCTPQKLVNYINDNKFDWNKVSLIVIDECHHVKKKHPCAIIMNAYQQQKKIGMRIEPRVIGLTASPATKQDVFIKLLGSMTCKIGCIFQNSPHYEELKKFVHIPKVEVLECFDDEGSKSLLDTIRTFALKKAQELWTKELTKEVSTHRREVLKGYTEEGENFDDLYLDELEEFADMEDPLDFINFFIDAFEDSKNSKQRALCDLFGLIEDIELGLKEDAMDTLTKVIEVFPELNSSLRVLNKIEKLQSPKVEKMFDILKDMKEPWKGLIFVTQRKSAQELVDIIKKRNNKIRCNFIVGHNNKKGDVRMSPSEQKEILDGFRGKDYDLLVCTNVAEEGIDVKECNLVIRLNEMTTAISMIQSRGRARYKNSKYYVMCSNESEMSKVKEVLKQEERMISMVQEYSRKQMTQGNFNLTWGHITDDVQGQCQITDQNSTYMLTQIDHNFLEQLYICRTTISSATSSSNSSFVSINSSNTAVQTNHTAQAANLGSRLLPSPAPSATESANMYTLLNSAAAMRSANETNYVGILQNYFQEKLKITATIKYESQKSGPDHAPVFVTVVTCPNGMKAKGDPGHNTKDTKQTAAREALKLLKLIK